MKVLIVFSLSMKSGALNVLGGDTVKNCEAGLAVWQQEAFDKIMFVGGIFCPPSVQTIPIAVLMAKWFGGRGVPEEKIITEIKSKDTWDNISNALEMLPQNSDISVVSQWQHVMRVRLIFSLGHGLKVKAHPVTFFFGTKRFVVEWLYLLLTAFDPLGHSWPAKYNRVKRSRF